MVPPSPTVSDERNALKGLACSAHLLVGAPRKQLIKGCPEVAWGRPPWPGVWPQGARGHLPFSNLRSRTPLWPGPQLFLNSSDAQFLQPPPGDTPRWPASGGQWGLRSWVPQNCNRGRKNGPMVTTSGRSRKPQTPDPHLSWPLATTAATRGAGFQHTAPLRAGCKPSQSPPQGRRPPSAAHSARIRRGCARVSTSSQTATSRALHTGATLVSL